MTMDDLRSVSVAARRIGGTLMAAFGRIRAGAGGKRSVRRDRRLRCERTRESVSLGRGPGNDARSDRLLVGLPLAQGMGRAVAGLLYGGAPNDLATLASVAIVLAVVALAAGYIPHVAPCGSRPSSRCATNNSFDE
jgi:hypothetical protein